MVRRAAMVAVLCCALLASLLAQAKPAGQPADGARQQARELARKGLTALSEERYGEAVALLREAERKFHAPTHLLYLARALTGLEQLVEAHALYVEVLTEQVPNYAPAAFHEAQQEARSDEQDLRSRIATVTIQLDNPLGETASVTLDGKDVAAERLAHPIAVEPGERLVEAWTQSSARESQTVVARIGEPQTVALELRRSSTERSPERSPETSSSPFPAAAAVALAVGGAALVAGGITGFLTLDQASDIETACGGSVCPPEQESEVDDAKTIGHTSTALFIVGGVGAALGVVLLLVDPGESNQSGTAAPSPRLEARVGPSGAMLRGRF